jgi:hypothetical protein
MLHLALPGDTVFSSSKNVLSSAICWFTRGPFSHVAFYVGDDQLWDITLRGSKRCSLTAEYKSPLNRVAILRVMGATDSRLERKLKAEAIGYDTHRGTNQGYDYIGAFADGMRTRLGYHYDSDAPNSFFYRGNWQLVAQA